MPTKQEKKRQKNRLNYKIYKQRCLEKKRRIEAEKLQTAIEASSAPTIDKNADSTSKRIDPSTPANYTFLRTAPIKASSVPTFSENISSTFKCIVGSMNGSSATILNKKKSATIKRTAVKSPSRQIVNHGDGTFKVITSMNVDSAQIFDKRANSTAITTAPVKIPYVSTLYNADFTSKDIVAPVVVLSAPTLDKNVDSISKGIDVSAENPFTPANYTAPIKALSVPTLDKNANCTFKCIAESVNVSSATILNKNDSAAIKNIAIETPSVQILDKVFCTFKDFAPVKVCSALTYGKRANSTALRIEPVKIPYISTLYNADVTSKAIITPVEVSSAPTLDKNATFTSKEIAKSVEALSAPALNNADSPSALNLYKNVDSTSLQTPATLNPDKNIVNALKKLTLSNKKFLDNFNPETSSRESRKINTKIRNSRTARRHPGALYDEHGIHIASGKDICDCLFPNCSGCFYECPKCASSKCGLKCRVNRKFVYEAVHFEGTNLTLKFKDITKDL